MNEWRVCILGDLVEERMAELQTGPFGTMLNASEYTPNGIPVIAVQDIGENKLHHNKFVYVSVDTAKRLSKYMVKEGDIIFGRKGAVERRARIKKHESGWLQGSDCIRLRFDESINSEFVSYQFGSTTYKTWMIQNSTGATMPSLNQQVLKLLPVVIPSIAEQKAIVSVLSSLDDKIALLHRQNKTLESMAETFFRQWFVEDAGDWRKGKLGDILTITSSKRIFYSEYVEDGIPFYRSKEIIELHNTGSTKSEIYIAENKFNEIKEKFGTPDEGDILLTSVGTLGIPYRVKIGDKFYFKDGNLTWFKDFNVIPSIIIYCWLKSSIGKSILNSIAIGSTQAALTICNLKEIDFLIPPDETIKSMEVNLTTIYKKTDANYSQIKKLERLRDNLLPKLMSGEVRVI